MKKLLVLAIYLVLVYFMFVLLEAALYNVDAGYRPTLTPTSEPSRTLTSEPSRTPTPDTPTSEPTSPGHKKMRVSSTPTINHYPPPGTTQVSCNPCELLATIASAQATMAHVISQP